MAMPDKNIEGEAAGAGRVSHRLVRPDHEDYAACYPSETTASGRTTVEWRCCDLGAAESEGAVLECLRWKHKLTQASCVEEEVGTNLLDHVPEESNTDQDDKKYEIDGERTKTQTPENNITNGSDSLFMSTTCSSASDCGESSSGTFFDITFDKGTLDYFLTEEIPVLANYLRNTASLTTEFYVLVSFRDETLLRDIVELTQQFRLCSTYGFFTRGAGAEVKIVLRRRKEKNDVQSSEIKKVSAAGPDTSDSTLLAGLDKESQQVSNDNDAPPRRPDFSCLVFEKVKTTRAAISKEFARRSPTHEATPGSTSQKCFAQQKDSSALEKALTSCLNEYFRKGENALHRRVREQALLVASLDEGKIVDDRENENPRQLVSPRSSVGMMRVVRGRNYSSNEDKTEADVSKLVAGEKNRNPDSSQCRDTTEEQLVPNMLLTTTSPTNSFSFTPLTPTPRNNKSTSPRERFAPATPRSSWSHDVSLCECEGEINTPEETSVDFHPNRYCYSLPATYELAIPMELRKEYSYAGFLEDLQDSMPGCRDRGLMSLAEIENFLRENE
ncbi:unnamed protein product [Amoebophrya sp. A120]|nr:unnamed protein product [Amoebophrya sp. A120]|eukprot:GSA120T00012016001.1